MVNTESPAARPDRPWWQRAPVLALAATLLLLALGWGWGAWRASSMAPQGDSSGLPWQVNLTPDGGSAVFGMALGRTSVADLETRFGDGLRLALAGGQGQPPALEAYVESFHAGFIDGKLVLSLAAEPRWLEQALARSPRFERSADGMSKRHALAADDLAAARRLVVSALTFIPAARLDEPTLLARFGPPAQRVAGAQGEVQLMYPSLGLAITVPPAEGPLARARAVLQYVAPREFEQRLRAPLAASPASS
ncbi:hypothetical protein [Ideonella sp. YS5]|uniref:hypothetical protein n=1 Tax=Ideonella sp. YS5 TaxID=3453714 RepID=UPI003EEC0737